MSSTPPPMYDAHSMNSYTSSLKPYLELNHLYSLAWLAYPILSLIFVALRLAISSDSITSAVQSAKSDLITGCKAAEQAATSAASMPRYLAIASNEQFADAVNATMSAARTTLVMALTIMEAIINFIVDIYRSTFLCFLELVIRGALAILISAVAELNSLVQSAASGLESSLEDSITAINSTIQSAVAAVNKVNPFGDITAPSITMPDLSALSNVSLPASIEDSLTSLNSSLPTFDDLKNAIEQIIDTPFEAVKKDINDTFAGFSFNSSVLPVPTQNTLSFCNDYDTSFMDDLGHDLVKLSKIGIVVIAVAALILFIVNCLFEWYKWRSMHHHFQYVREAWTSHPTSYAVAPAMNDTTFTMTDHNLILLSASSSHPLITRIVNNVSRRFHLSPTAHTHITWFLHYVFHPPALACLLIGVFGLLSVEIQLAALGPITEKYSNVAASQATDFSNTIAASINSSMYNQSALYAQDVNGQIDTMQTTINDGVFGWVNITTTTLNDTIVTFYDEVQSAVETLFNGTVFEQVALDFVNCLIGSKVDAIEEALTFLHDNLIIDLPQMNSSALVLSQASVNEAVQPIAAAAVGDDSSGNGGIVQRLVSSYEESLKKERVMFTVFIALWGLVVLIAMCILLWHLVIKKHVEMRARRRWAEQRGGFVVPYHMDKVEKAEPFGTSNGVLRSFTPMPPLGTDSEEHSTYQPFSEAEPEPRMGWISRFVRQKKPINTRDIGYPQNPETSTMNDFDPHAPQGNRTTAWFGRFAAMLAKNDVERHSVPPARQKPHLGINIERASGTSEPPQPVDEPHLQSRWSNTPPQTGPLSWMPISPPAWNRASRKMPKTNSVVPTDVGPIYEESIRSSPLAPPLHHGFADVPPPQHPDRRSLSVPAWKWNLNKNVSMEDDLLTPDARMSLPARKSSSVLADPGYLNPFVTPFDDEHRVHVSAPLASPRRSVQTNPFEAGPLVL